MNNKDTYSKKLKDPRWQKKRLEVFNRDGWTCQSCGAKDKTLHIHHIKYLPKAEPWEYENHYLVTYCDTCHESEHLIGEVTRESIVELIETYPVLFKPLAQLCVLIYDHQDFYPRLKEFLNDQMIEMIKSKSQAA